jgi:hypothetical protein
LDYSNLARFLKDPKISQEDIDELFSCIDIDGNGGTDKIEFVHGFDMLSGILMKEEGKKKDEGEKKDEEEEKEDGFTEDDWIVEIDDFIRANNKPIQDYMHVKSYQGIRYVKEDEVIKFFSHIKMPAAMERVIIEKLRMDDFDGDGRKDLLSFRSIEKSLKERKLCIEFEKIVNVNDKLEQILEGMRRYMFNHN